MKRRHFLAAAGALPPALPFAFALPRSAEAASNRPLRLVVPYAAGGPTDAMARVLQPLLQDALAETLIIENAPGAGGAIGAQAVVRSAADGRTFFLGNNGPSAVTPLLLRENAGFDPVKDFIPVGMIARATMLLAVSADVPATDMKSFIAHAKAHPGQLNFASAGVGSLGHLASELLAREAGLKMTHVSYKGQAPTLNALLAGEVQMLLTTPTAAMRGHIASGRIKLIAVTSQARSPQYPETDVVRSTVPDFVVYSWFALMARSGTPEKPIAAMRQALKQALSNPEVRRKFEDFGVSADDAGPDQVARYIRQDLSRWGAVIRELGIKPE